VTTPQVILPVDLTGTSSDNFVSGEFHEILGGVKTMIRPNFGAFYKQGFQLFGVSSANNLTLMRPGIDYDLGHLDEDATAQADGDVYQVVLIKDTRFFTSFSISYHAFGGANNVNYARMWNEYKQSLEGTPVPYANLFNVPNTFNPVSHKNDVLDLYGLEFVKSFLDNIKNALTASRTTQARVVEIRSKLRTFEADALQASANLPVAVRQHIDNIGFPHSYTKAMIGLGAVANYAFNPVVVGSDTLPAYASPQVLQYWTTNPPAYAPPCTRRLDEQSTWHDQSHDRIGLGQKLSHYRRLHACNVGIRDAVRSERHRGVFGSLCIHARRE
jgi:hypothetical protein